MDKYTRFQVISNLNTTQAVPPVRACLHQSSMACEANDLRSMTTLATFALDVAHACNDKTGKALALIHVGLSSQNIEHIRRARRIFWRDTTLETRHNEACSFFSLGAVCERGNPAQAIGYYHKAATMLFDSVRITYAAQGDDVRYRAVMDLHAALQGRIDNLTPSVWVDHQQIQ